MTMAETATVTEKIVVDRTVVAVFDPS